MRVSRWIKFPLLCAVLLTLPQLIIVRDFSLWSFLTFLVFGAIFGLAFQAWSDIRARQRAKGITDPDIYNARHERVVTVLLGPENAFQLCLEAMRSIEGMNLKLIDEANLQIVGRSRLTWESFGTTVTLSLTTIADALTEVRINTRPFPPTAQVDYGEGWEYVELLVSYLRRHDANVGETLLDEGASIINDAARRPIGFDVREKTLR